MPAGMGCWWVFARLCWRCVDWRIWQPPARKTSKPDPANGERCKGGVIISGSSSVQVIDHCALSNVIRCAWLAVALPLAIRPSMDALVFIPPSSWLTPVSSHTELNCIVLKPIMQLTSTVRSAFFRDCCRFAGLKGKLAERREG